MVETRPPEWQHVVCKPLAVTEKPRKSGLTMVIDKGLGPNAFQDLLTMGAASIDFIKLGFGTSLLCSREVLREKLAIAQQHAVIVYPGGTLLEVAELQGKAEQFIAAVSDLGIRLVEVSEGTISLTAKRRAELIYMAKSHGLRVISEVGKKQKGSRFQPENVHAQVRADLDAGAELVIVEGRDSGKGVGVYDDAGHMDESMVDAILAGVPDQSVLIWEAPLVAQQQSLILKLGNSVNLGNIQPEDAVTLAATRAGLRGDTFRLIVEQQQKDVE